MLPKKYAARANIVWGLCAQSRARACGGGRRSVAIETHARAGIGSANDNVRTVLRRVLGLFARNDHEVKVPGLSECVTATGPIVLTCLHPVSFSAILHSRANDQDEHLQRVPIGNRA